MTKNGEATTSAEATKNYEWRRFLLSGIIGALLGALISSTASFLSMSFHNEARKKEAERARRLYVIERYSRACNRVIMESTRLDSLMSREAGDLDKGVPMSDEVFNELLEIQREDFANRLEYKVQADIANLTFGQELAMPSKITEPPDRMTHETIKETLAARSVQVPAAEKQCDDTVKRMFDLVSK